MFGILDSLECNTVQVVHSEETEEVEANSSRLESQTQALLSSDTPGLEDDPFVSLIRIHLLLRVSIAGKVLRQIKYL